MGTRSLTHVIKTYKASNGKMKKVTLATIYRQMDGYPSGMGKDLADFIKGGKLVNGISFTENQRVFNGAGCFGAQLIKELKDGAGGIYLEPINASKCGEEYIYKIIIDEWETRTITLECYEVGYMNKKNNYVNKKKLLFSVGIHTGYAYAFTRGY